ncbi:MAG TPA: hypothetical protein HA226_05235 [Nanoarchaeota archaeon]|nr:hypothetical protein [Nanoarchaeota archaeon]
MVIRAEIRVTLKPKRSIYNIGDVITVEASCVLEQEDYTGYLWYFSRDEPDESSQIVARVYRNKKIRVAEPNKNKRGLSELILKGKQIQIPTALFMDGYYTLYVDLLKNYERNKDRDFDKVPDSDIIGTYSKEISILLQ